MSIQTIIDKAQQIEIDRKKIVSQTISRSQRVKTAERSTAQPWRFKVTPPGALRWNESRDMIETIDNYDRFTEYTISLNNNSAMNYITEYQGGLSSTMTNALTISSTGTSTLVLGTLPALGSTVTNRTVTVTARSFATATNATYNQAFNASRYDFLITDSEYDAKWNDIKVGNRVNAAIYVDGSSNYISSITRNYLTIKGVGYTRIVMNATAWVNSDNSSYDGEMDIPYTTINRTVEVNSQTYVLRSGDFIQPSNSRYPYTVLDDVVRGSGSTVSVSLNRPLITSEGISYVGQTVKVGNSCTWRVVVAGLPTYQLIPNRLVQYTGDFELIERII